MGLGGFLLGVVSTLAGVALAWWALDVGLEPRPRLKPAVRRALVDVAAEARNCWQIVRETFLIATTINRDMLRAGPLIIPATFGPDRTLCTVVLFGAAGHSLDQRLLRFIWRCADDKRCARLKALMPPGRTRVRAVGVVVFADGTLPIGFQFSVDPGAARVHLRHSAPGGECRSSPEGRLLASASMADVLEHVLGSRNQCATLHRAAE